MAAMDVDFEGSAPIVQSATPFQWIGYVAVPFIGKVLKCINGQAVELLDDFPKASDDFPTAKASDATTEQPKPDLKIKTPSYDEKDFWADTPNSSYSYGSGYY